MTGILVPLPGAHLVPEGWWEATFVPWADDQVSDEPLVDAAAQLAGLEAAYRLLGQDTLELTRARRYLELRWGELLGEARPGPQKESSPASDDLGRMDRHRFRQLAAARPLIIEALRAATDGDELTRAALLRIARPRAATPADVGTMLRGLSAGDTPANGSEDAGGRLDTARERLTAERPSAWTDQHTRKRHRVLDLLDETRTGLDQATEPGLSAHAVADVLRDAALKARQVASALDELAFTFER